MKSPFAVPAASLLCVSLTALTPVAVQAQTSPDAWQWEGAVYGWFPSIGVQTEFPSGGSGPTVNVSADTMIDSLKMAAMGSFGGKKGQWGFWTDFAYSDVGGSKKQTRDFSLGSQGLPGSLSANLALDIKSMFWTLAGTYEVAKSATNTSDFLFGTRLADIRETLNWSVNGDIGGAGLFGQSGSARVDMSHWDAVIGVKGVAYIDSQRKWLVPYYVDIGTGQSKLTWQANLGVGYRFDWGTTVLSWRYLDYQMKSGIPISNIGMSGLLLGVAFQF